MKKNINSLTLCYALLAITALSAISSISAYIILYGKAFQMSGILRHLILCIIILTIIIAGLVLSIRDYLSDISANAYKDVTGVHGKNALEKKMRELEEKNSTLNIGVMMFDLNNLKKINDTYGHEKGDLFIQSFASCLTRILNTDSFLARFGGDEFVIIQENATVRLLEEMDCRLQNLIKDCNLRADVPLSYAVGYDVSYKNHYYLLSDLINIADEKMYQDKARKKAAAAYTTSTEMTVMKPFPPVIAADKIAENITALLNESKPESSFALVQSDINSFHLINELFGFKTGNEILLTLSTLLPQPENSIFTYRCHSDNFVSIVESTGYNHDDFQTMIENRNQEISALIAKLHNVSYFSLNTGIYFITDKKILPDIAMSNANLARKKAKDTLLHVCAFSNGIALQEKKQAEILHSFHPALAAEEFQIYFQPKISALTGKISSAEALVRWKKDEFTLWQPDEFIPLLEKTGAITDLDFYVYEKTFRWIKKRVDAGLKVVPISLNVSPVHFRNHESFVSKILELMNRYCIAPELIILEITESVYVENTALVNHIIQHFHERNIQISMDDFGSGFSSLNSLKDILFDEVKIDKKFLSEGISYKSKIVLQELFHMLKRMKKTIVCEGVETDTVSAFLKEEGCDEMQGFLYYKPMKERDFSSLL